MKDLVLQLTIALQLKGELKVDLFSKYKHAALASNHRLLEGT